MSLSDGFTDISPGKIANIVTYLEMLEGPIHPPTTKLDKTKWKIKYISSPGCKWYLNLYREVGQDWLWFSRLLLEETVLERIINDKKVKIFSLQYENQDCGFFELDYHTPLECELVFLGISKKYVGQGIGTWLLNQAIHEAWQENINRLWLHTCTMDHPSALSLYMKSGFKPYKRQVEVLDDPRLTGHLPKDAAHHTPII